jgi:hypothetical protein
MKSFGVLFFVLGISAVMADGDGWKNFYTGGLVEASTIWTWGFAAEPKSVENTGFDPGTSAVEVVWTKSDGFDYATWSSYGVYFGDVPFSMMDIQPDSVYFKLRAPDGVGETDRLRVWLYDPRNSDWNNAYFFELENLAVLQDQEWHLFSINLWDFEMNVGDMDYTNVIAVSIERPAEDDDTAFPLMYIDHVWVGLPDFVSVEEKAAGPVGSCSLKQNFPNPFNPSTRILFELNGQAPVAVSIFNARGEKVEEWASGSLQAGTHSFEWNAGHLPSGTYFCRLQAGDGVQMRKMLLLR